MYATLGQYQSFALIAYDALRMQTANVNAEKQNGKPVFSFVRTLYIAKKAIDLVLAYSTSSLSFTAYTENDIIAVCDYLKNTLLFDCESINQLPETYLNGNVDFDIKDFNPQDFA